MTIDDLALAVEQEFQVIHQKFEEVHQEFYNIRQEIVDFKLQVLLAIESIDIHLSAYTSRTSEDISRLQEVAQEHDGRLRILEQPQ
jgi:proline dehydrogenase